MTSIGRLITLLLLAIIVTPYLSQGITIAFPPVNYEQQEKVFVIASWVGPITDVRFNMVGPAFWWDLGNELIWEKLAIYVRKTSTFIPWLAESWEWDNNKFIIHLRNNVTWSDGHPFTSKDVWTQIIIVKEWGWREYQDIINVTTPDDYTVVLYMKPGIWRLLEEYFILYALPMTMPYHIYGQWAEEIVDAKAAGNTTRVQEILAHVYEYNPDTPIGTGPYMLESRTSAEAILVKRAGYWRPQGQIFDKIKVIRAQDNPHMWNYYMGGAVDSGDAVMNPDVESQVLSKPWTKIVKVPDSGVAIYFNVQAPWFNLTEVRQAIAYVIDRAAAVQSWSSIYTPVEIPDALHDWMRSDWLDQATINMLDHYEKNLDKARQLLESVGFTKGPDGKWYTPNGELFTIRFYAPSGWSDWSTIGQAIAAQLSDFGFNVDFRAVEDTTYWNVIWNGKQFDMIMNWWGAWNIIHPWTCHWQWISRFEGLGLNLTYTIPGYGTLNASTLWRQLENDNETLVRNAARLLSILVNKELPILPIGEKKIPIFVNTREGLNSPFKIEWPSDDDPLWWDGSISRFETTIVMFLLGKVKLIETGMTPTGTATTTPPSGTPTTTPPPTEQAADYTIYIIIGVVVAVIAIGAFIVYKKRR